MDVDGAAVVTAAAVVAAGGAGFSSGLASPQPQLSGDFGINGVAAKTWRGDDVEGEEELLPLKFAEDQE